MTDDKEFNPPAPSPQGRTELLLYQSEDGHQKQLDALAKREAQAWQEVDALIAMRQPKKYDEAVQLLRDLCDLAGRGGQTATAITRLNALRDAHSGKPSLLRRLDDAKL